MSAVTETVVARKKRFVDLPKHAIIWLVLAMELIPMYMMIQISGKDNTTFMLNPWWPVGLREWAWENLAFGFQLIGPYIANTVFVTVSITFFSMILAVMAAYFFARYRMPLHGVLWYFFLILMLMPGVANIVPLFMLLKSMNLLNTLWALIVIGIAGGQVFKIFVLRNFIEDIPRDLFEAAQIDGASHLQQIRHIVLPMAAPIIGTLAILAFLSQWNDFMMPLIILRDKELFTLGVGLIYLDGEYVKQWGQIMAAFLIASVPLFILFIFCMKLFVRGLAAGAVKG
jgi:multiple sugar transport system permease protein